MSSIPGACTPVVCDSAFETPGRGIVKKFWVGTAGWSYKDWKGTVYPGKTRRDFKPLQFLTDYFDCAEVNATFYAQPNLYMARGWVRMVSSNPDFLLTIKLLSRFTHERKETLDSQALETFKRGIEPLLSARRFGALLLQFPWSFRYTPENCEYLRKLAAAFLGVPKVVEVRHASWDSPEALDFFRREGLNFCNIDQPKIRDCLGTTAYLTGPIGYVRLHGRNRENWFREDAGRDARYDYYYSAQEIDEWIPRIKKLIEEAEFTFVIANNHYEGQAPANALQIKSKLARQPVAIPPELLRTYPDLAEFAREPAKDVRRSTREVAPAGSDEP